MQMISMLVKGALRSPDASVAWTGTPVRPGAAVDRPRTTRVQAQLNQADGRRETGPVYSGKRLAGVEF
jgi:hypothetical protein